MCRSVLVGVRMEENRVPLITSLTPSKASFDADEDDIESINGLRGFVKEFHYESKKLWYLAGPAIFTSLCQYSLGAVSQICAGHVGTIQLAAVSIQISVIAGFSEGVLVLTLILILISKLKNKWIWSSQCQ